MRGRAWDDMEDAASLASSFERRRRLDTGSDMDALRLSGIIGGGVGGGKVGESLGPEAPINMIGDKSLISIFDETKVRPKNIDGKGMN